MAGLKVELPQIQNWNCHNCSGCCRQHAIEITDEERQRIVDQKWEKDDAIGPGVPTVVDTGPFWNRTQRLAHQADGACVFLGEDGLCRIHAKFGEAAKPLACRVYPYAFHPSGNGVTVSLRFSCPSVVGNRGKELTKQATEIRQIAKAVVPERTTDWPAPEISPGVRLGWGDFQKFIEALDQTLAMDDAPILVRLLRTLTWLNLVSEAKFDNVKGARLAEFLVLICEAAAGEVTPETLPTDEPAGVAKTQFRLLAGQYARRDTAADLEQGWRGHWERFRFGVRFARGKGNLPPVQDCLGEVPFDALELPFGGLPEGADDLFERYFRVKTQGLAFCGPAYYGTPLVEGFQSLVLMYPAVLWLARWLAATEKRTALSLNDVEQAMTIADHHHGYSPAFGTGGFRGRVRLLARMDAIGALCEWYSR